MVLIYEIESRRKKKDIKVEKGILVFLILGEKKERILHTQRIPKWNPRPSLIFGAPTTTETQNYPQPNQQSTCLFLPENKRTIVSTMAERKRYTGGRKKKNEHSIFKTKNLLVPPPRLLMLPLTASSSPTPTPTT